MATVPQDRDAHVRDTTGEGVAFNADTTIDPIRSGALVMQATVGGEEKYQTATATVDGRKVVGVVQQRTPQPRSEPGGPEAPAVTQGVVRTDGIYSFNGRAAETYKAGDNVVIDGTPADGQSVRLFDAGAGDSFQDIVGKVAFRTPVGGVVGGAFNVEVWIAPTKLGRNNGVDSITLI